MPNQGTDTTLPALDLLRRIAARGADGLSRRELFDDGWPAHVVSRLLDALRSRGYVRFDSATCHWVASESGLRRAEQARVQEPLSLPRS
jgi:DNA-binding IclR family transcriptional regulator